MGKWIGIAFVVIGVWVALTIFTEGSDRAFGGLFASRSAARQPPAEAPLDRIRHSAEAARQEQLDRIERQVGDD